MTALAAASDGLVLAGRNLRKVQRVPELLVSVLVMPLVMVPLFTYVFGSAIEIPGASYRDFLIGGLFAMTLTFGAVFTGAGLAEDLQKGIIARFRTLPIARSAVIVGRTTSDVVYNLLGLAVMAATGLLVGWRISDGLGRALLGFGLLLLFAHALSWIMAYVGLLVPSPEAINNASFIVVAPLTFVSNAFVPTDGLPAPLRVFAEWNPVSAVTQAARELFGNIPPGMPEPAAWPLRNAVDYTLLCTVAIIVVFAPLAMLQYRRTSAR